MLKAILVVICLMILIVVSIAILVLSISENEGDMTWLSLAAIVIFLALLIYSVVLYANQPEPLDVYRGKTELKINGSYIGDTFEPTDSTVVWRETK